MWAVAWSKDGTELVTGGKDGSVRGWDPAAQALGPYTVVPSQVQPWGGLDFLPDGQTFLMVGSRAMSDAEIKALPATLVLPAGIEPVGD